MPRNTNENFKPSRTEWDTFHKNLGHKYKISYRVIAILRSHFGLVAPDGLPESDEELYKLTLEFRRHMEKKVARMKENVLPQKLALSRLILQKESSLNGVQHRVSELQEGLPHFCSAIERMTLHDVVCKYLKFVEKEPSVLREIVNAEITKEGLLEEQGLLDEDFV